MNESNISIQAVYEVGDEPVHLEITIRPENQTLEGEAAAADFALDPLSWASVWSKIQQSLPQCTEEENILQSTPDGRMTRITAPETIK